MQCDSSLVTRKELLLGGIGLVAVESMCAVEGVVKIVELRKADLPEGAGTNELVEAVQPCLQVSFVREHLHYTPLFSRIPRAKRCACFQVTTRGDALLSFLLLRGRSPVAILAVMQDHVSRITHYSSLRSIPFGRTNIL